MFATGKLRKKLRAISALLFATTWSVLSGLAQCSVGRRPVTVADSIEMTELTQQDEGSAAVFSPSGDRFAIVLLKGRLADNTNLSTMEVFSVAQVFHSKTPNAVVKFASSSNLPGISNVIWLTDNQTLLFIGERGSKPAQIYAYSVAHKRLRRLTNQATSILNFSASEDGKTIVYVAQPAVRNIVRNQQTLRNGFVVRGQELTSLLFSGYRTQEAMNSTSRELYQLVGSGPPKRVEVQDAVWNAMPLSVSPDGHYALVEALATHVPDTWKSYGNGVFHVYVTAHTEPGAISEIETYLLLDTHTGKISSLLGMPKEWDRSGFFWLNGGRSLIVSSSYLPTDGVRPEDRAQREEHPSVVEIELPSKRMTEVDPGHFSATSWDAATQQLSLTSVGMKESVRKRYQKHASVWTQVPDTPVPNKTARIEVKVVQEMNLPPSVWLIDHRQDRKRMLVDLNPEFERLCFARETKFDWKGTDGRSHQGGLYLPLHYKPGERYPLVIQTHAFNPDQFWIDGPWHSGYAAQALAAKGIAVLQMGYDHEGRSTPMEAPQVLASLEGAIEALDRAGTIDPDKIGILGFSRTVFHVAYALTHSKIHFRAATLADGVDEGYLQTLTFPTTVAPDAIAVNGGPPWGHDLTRWLERSPLFNIEAVNAPVRLESYGMSSVLEMWGWYSLLERRQMPVDMVVLPDAPHLLVKPWERQVSQQGNVDWFAFWLKGEEDPSPAKADQYTRWRQMRDLLASRPAMSPTHDAEHPLPAANAQQVP
jgi:dipeptidyl aminopeptidase/acylaminoacyl peptidase